MSVLAHAIAVVTSKGAIGVAVAALALGAATAATEASVTGSANPTNWGQQVVVQVNKCKAALAPGSHGIGQCVSSFAKQHGQEVSAGHRASAARTNGDNHPGSTDHPSSTNHSTSTTHPTGPPTSHP